MPLLIAFGILLYVLLGIVGFVGIMRPCWYCEKYDIGNWVFLLPFCIIFAPLSFLWNWRTAFRKPTSEDVLAHVAGRVFSDYYNI